MSWRAAVLLAALPACAPKAPPRERAQCVQLVASADLHGHLSAAHESSRSRGGLENVGAFVEGFRRHFGERLLYVDSGDWMQGTLPSNLTQGEATIAGFNALRPAASTIGNHELDFDAADPQEHRVLAARIRQASFPVVACNIRDRRTGLLPAELSLRPSTLASVAGIRIGIVGTATVDTPVTTFPGNVGELEFVDPLECVRREASALREQGARFVVLITHSGAACTSATECAPDGELVRLLERLPKGTIDAAAAGHTHKKISATINGVPMVEPGVNGEALGWISLCDDGAVRHAVIETCRSGDRACEAPADARWLAEPHSLPDATTVLEAVAPYLRRVEELQQQPIGAELARPLGRDDRHVSALGAFAAEAIRRAVPDADVGVINAGGLRADLPAGRLRLHDVFEAFPFDNRVVVARMTPVQLEGFLTTLWRVDTRMPQLSGAALSIVGGQPRLLLPDSLQARDALNVATVDFLALGGDGAPKLTERGNAQQLSAPGPLVRDAVIAHLRALRSH